MVNYYFDGKAGLFVALIESLFGEWTRRLRTIELHPCEGGSTPTRLFVEAVHHCFYLHRTVLWLLDQELRDSASVISEAFKRKLAAQSSSAIQRFLKSMGEQGFYRQNMDLRYATFAVSALAMYPSVFAQGLERSYGIQPYELAQPDWQNFLERSLNQLLMPA
jgi:AcrR family transcriptional regulator